MRTHLNSPVVLQIQEGKKGVSARASAPSLGLTLAKLTPETQMQTHLQILPTRNFVRKCKGS